MSSSELPALPALPAPVSLFPYLVAQRPETLILREKVMSLTGDSFDIKLANGTPILKVEGKAMTMSGRKKCFDMQGNNIFDIVQEYMHLHRTFKVVVGEGTKEMREVTVKSGFSLKGNKATITFTSNSGKAETLQMRGNFFATKADITDEIQNGVVVAHIDRQWLKKNEYFFGQQTYAVQVAPGMDLALVAAICICLDELNEPNK